jgi:hypothetical protein
MQTLAMQTLVALASAGCYVVCAVFWMKATWAPKPQSDTAYFPVVRDDGHTPQSRAAAKDNVIAALFTAAGAILSAAGEIMNVWMK